MNDKRTPLLSVKNIYKAFGSNSVLNGINLDIYPGDVLALIGGNGAGKSTLVKSVMGIKKPDSGEILIEGKAIPFGRPSASLNVGAYLIPQEPMLFPNMTLAENVIIGIKGKKKDLYTQLSRILSQLGWKLDLNRSARTLSIAEQQLVEILRGLLRDARILFFDEPTSSLTFDEVNSLFSVIENLKKKNVGIIYITHRLNEVFQIANRVALLRDGVIIMEGGVGEFTHEMLVQGLLPENAEAETRQQESASVDYTTKPVFTLENYTGYGFSDVTMNIYPGEIVGMAGVVGAGRTELATTIFGRDKVLKGKVHLAGEDVTGLSTVKIIKKGINYVPEDRFLHGIFKITNVTDNLTSACIKSLSKVMVCREKENSITHKYIKNFRIKVDNDEQEMGSLSGGNQQKVVIARGLSTTPKLVILDEPTRGIDAGARSDVYSIIVGLKKTGVAILLISSDMEEIVQLSDRVVTMYRGRINQEFKKEEINQDSIMSASFGITKKENK
jgi:AI-2 transport system ATP-binding protein